MQQIKMNLMKKKDFGFLIIIQTILIMDIILILVGDLVAQNLKKPEIK